MAKILEKNTTLFERDEKGQLIPQLVNLEVDKDNVNYNELKDVQIKIVPMTRGEIKKIFSALDGTKDKDRDIDEEVILNHCKEPLYTKEDIKFLKSDYSTPIVATILKHSGLDAGKGKEAALKEVEDDFAKN